MTLRPWHPAIATLTGCGGGSDDKDSSSSASGNTTVSGTSGFNKSVSLTYSASSTLNVSATSRKIFFYDSTQKIWVGVNYNPTTGAYTSIEYQDTNGAGLMLICTVGGLPARECPASSITFNATTHVLKLTNTAFAAVDTGTVNTSLTW